MTKKEALEAIHAQLKQLNDSLDLVIEKLPLLYQATLSIGWSLAFISGFITLAFCAYVLHQAFFK